jgi:hypothetical protein
MRWEALLWSVLAIAAPAAAALLWRRTRPSLPPWAEPLVQGAGWLHGLLLPYLALLLGSIPGGLVGLYAIGPLEWITGSLACLLGLIAVIVSHRVHPVNRLHARSAVDRWKDEPRWALYRATGALWVDDLALGAGLGLALSALEWALSGLARNPRDLSGQDPEPLYRSATSTALFLLTHNFWLTAGTQMILFLLLEYWSRAKRGPQTDDR